MSLHVSTYDRRIVGEGMLSLHSCTGLNLIHWWDGAECIIDSMGVRATHALFASKSWSLPSFPNGPYLRAG